MDRVKTEYYDDIAMRLSIRVEMQWNPRISCTMDHGTHAWSASSSRIVTSKKYMIKQ